MTTPLDQYKLFIDDMVSISDSAAAKWVVENGFPDSPENVQKNELLKSLSKSQKEVISQIINDAKSSGIHDVLAYFNEKQNFNEIKVIKNDLELPVEPFNTEMYYDYIARLNGDQWPEQNEL